jgi:hypothetical protein
MLKRFKSPIEGTSRAETDGGTDRRKELTLDEAALVPAPCHRGEEDLITELRFRSHVKALPLVRR